MYDLKRVRERYIEAELANYHRTKKELEEIERDIIFGSDRRFKERLDSGRISDSTADRAIALLEHRKLERLRRIVRAIEAAYEEMTEEQRRIVHMRYWTRPPREWKEIAKVMSYSERQVYNFRNKLLQMIDSRL